MIRAGATLVGLCFVACNGATDDPGTSATLRITGAQFVSGAMPAGSSSGPAVGSILLPTDQIHPGFYDDPLTGALAPSSTAAAIGIDGDVGYWIVPAGVPAVATPTYPSFQALLAFAPSLVPGPYTLTVHAIDAQGTFGAAETEVLTAAREPTPTGALVITLTWDVESDLDLHVIDPNGNEIFHGDPSSEPPPPFNEVDGGSYGYLDGDSNGNCVIDGRRQEDVLWPDAPPVGHYLVRVDTASMCGQPIAHWSVSATLYGRSLGEASGVSLEVDAEGSHDRGAGVLALQLDVP